MVDLSRVQELADRLAQALPPGLASARDELRENFRAILQARLEQLDVVSAEQFEVQQQVLRRTQQRLRELEERLAKLEQQA